MKKHSTAAELRVMLLRMQQPVRSPLRATAVVRLLGWLTVLVGAVVLLTALGTGALGVPSILNAAAWGPWFAARDAATIVFALLRVVTLAIAWYLLGVTLVGVSARALRSARLVAVADLVTVPAVRRLLQSALGVGLAAAALTAGSSPRIAAMPPAVAAASVQAAADAVEMTPVETDDAVLIPVPVAEDPPPPAPAGAVEWIVEPGESFWSIAQTVLTQDLGRAPSDDAIARYWERLVDRNRSRLSDPGNPDLIYPGQRFVLPDAGPVDR